MVHIFNKLEAGDVRAHAAQLNTVIEGNQGVLQTVQEEARTLSLSDVVDVAKALIHGETNESAPAEEVFCCILDADERRHEQNSVARFL